MLALSWSLTSFVIQVVTGRCRLSRAPSSAPALAPCRRTPFRWRAAHQLGCPEPWCSVGRVSRWGGGCGGARRSRGLRGLSAGACPCSLAAHRRPRGLGRRWGKTVTRPSCTPTQGPPPPHQPLFPAVAQSSGPTKGRSSSSGRAQPHLASPLLPPALPATAKGVWDSSLLSLGCPHWRRPPSPSQSFPIQMLGIISVKNWIKFCRLASHPGNLLLAASHPAAWKSEVTRSVTAWG